MQQQFLIVCTECDKICAELSLLGPFEMHGVRCACGGVAILKAKKDTQDTKDQPQEQLETTSIDPVEAALECTS